MSKQLQKKYESVCQQYVDLFSLKHEVEFEGWIRTGSLALFADYYIDFDNIRYDIDNDVEESKFFEWYDYVIEKMTDDDNAYFISYENYLKGVRYEEN